MTGYAGTAQSSTGGGFRLGIRKKIFMMKLIKHWNKLPREMLDHRITEWLGLERNSQSSSCKLQPRAGLTSPAQAAQGPSSLALNASRDGISIASLCCLCQCLTTHARLPYILSVEGSALCQQICTYFPIDHLRSNCFCFSPQFSRSSCVHLQALDKHGSFLALRTSSSLQKC